MGRGPSRRTGARRFSVRTNRLPQHPLHVGARSCARHDPALEGKIRAPPNNRRNCALMTSAPAATPSRGLRIRGEVSAKGRGGGGAPPPVKKKLAGSRSTLSHVDTRGRVKMVDVGAKPVTAREAIARGTIT